MSTSTPVDAALPSAERAPLPPALAGDRTLLAIGLVILSTVVFAASDIAAKMMQAEASADRITWWRYVVYFALVLPLAWRRNGRRALVSAAPLLQIARGVCAIGATLFFVQGLSYLEVPEITAIVFVSPIFVMALSVPFLGEVVGIRRWAAALVGFAGVLVIVRPGTGSFQIAALLPVASALVGAGAAVITRRLRADSAETTMLWTAVIGFAAVTALVLPHWSAPSSFEVACGVVGGLGFAAGQVMCVFAYRLAPVSVIAPFGYVQMLSAGILSYAFWGVVPGASTLFGAAMIAASGIYSAHRERRRAAERRSS